MLSIIFKLFLSLDTTGKVLNISVHAIVHTTLPVPQAGSTISGKPVLKIVAYKPR